MTGNVAKTRNTEERSPVEARRKTTKILDFRRTNVFGGPSGRLRVALMARGIEIEALFVISSTMWRAGAPIMKLNGKSRFMGTWDAKNVRGLEEFCCMAQVRCGEIARIGRHNAVWTIGYDYGENT
jgi:hypothetical protein